MDKEDVKINELNLVQEEILFLLKQISTNNQVGLSVFFVLIGVALSILKESYLFSGIVFILGFFLLGIFGYLNRRNSKYLRKFFLRAKELQIEVGMKYYLCLEHAQKELSSWEDKLFAPRILKYLKWIALIIGYSLIILSFIK